MSSAELNPPPLAMVTAAVESVNNALGGVMLSSPATLSESLMRLAAVTAEAVSTLARVVAPMIGQLGSASEEVVAIERVLGVNPHGEHDDVTSRLSAVESAVGALEAMAHPPIMFEECVECSGIVPPGRMAEHADWHRRPR